MVVIELVDRGDGKGASKEAGKTAARPSIGSRMRQATNRIRRGRVGRIGRRLN